MRRSRRKKVAWWRFVTVVIVLLLTLSVYEGWRLVIAQSHAAEIFARFDRPGVLAVRLGQMAPERVAMLLRVQDPDFYRHHGVDLTGETPRMTTVTQSIVKDLFFEHFTPGFAKVEQTLIAWLVVDPSVPKDRQLEIFINDASLGHLDGREIRGFPAAAVSFYGKQVCDLDETEFLSLVAMLISPNGFNPRLHPKDNIDRVSRLRRLLAGECHEQGLVDSYLEACVG